VQPESSMLPGASPGVTEQILAILPFGTAKMGTVGAASHPQGPVTQPGPETEAPDRVDIFWSLGLIRRPLLVLQIVEDDPNPGAPLDCVLASALSNARFAESLGSAKRVMDAASIQLLLRLICQGVPAGLFAMSMTLPKVGEHSLCSWFAKATARCSGLMLSGTRSYDI
jgi:hypothetical protein